MTYSGTVVIQPGPRLNLVLGPNGEGAGIDAALLQSASEVVLACSQPHARRKPSMHMRMLKAASQP
jgi:hypothetical protein